MWLLSSSRTKPVGVAHQIHLRWSSVSRSAPFKKAAPMPIWPCGPRKHVNSQNHDTAYTDRSQMPRFLARTIQQTAKRAPFGSFAVTRSVLQWPVGHRFGPPTTTWRGKSLAEARRSQRVMKMFGDRRTISSFKVSSLSLTPRALRLCESPLYLRFGVDTRADACDTPWRDVRLRNRGFPVALRAPRPDDPSG